MDYLSATMPTLHPLAAYRKSREITQAQLARLLGVSMIAVSRWERRVRTPRAQQRRKIREVTGIEPAALLSTKELNEQGERA